MDTNKQGVIILHTNTAMNRLYSRFALRLRETDVETVEGQRVYEVAPDLIKILTVSDSDGVEFPLNVRGDRWAMQSTSDNELKVPVDLRAQTLTVEYQAGPDPLSLEDFDLDFEIELPEVLHPALTAYIAAEVYGSMNGKEHAAVSAAHRDKFEDICTEVELRDMLTTEKTGKFSKFDRNGWV